VRKCDREDDPDDGYGQTEDGPPATHSRPPVERPCGLASHAHIIADIESVSVCMCRSQSFGEPRQ